MNKEKAGYIELLEGKKGADAQKLAELAIARRIEEENGLQKKTTQKGSNKGQEYQYSRANFAAIAFSCEQGGELITIEPKAFKSIPKKVQEGKEKGKDLSDGHSERYAIAYVINEAIVKGWQPTDEHGLKLNGFRDLPPLPDDLLKYKKALKSTNIRLLTEQDFCLTKNVKNYYSENKDCTEVLNQIFDGENHQIYYCVPYGSNSMFQECMLAKNHYQSLRSSSSSSSSLSAFNANPKKSKNSPTEDNPAPPKKTKVEDTTDINPTLLRNFITNQDKLIKAAANPVENISVKLPLLSMPPHSITGMLPYGGSRPSGLRRPTKSPQTIINFNTNPSKTEEQTDSLEYEGMTEEEARQRCDGFADMVRDFQSENNEKFTMEASPVGNKTNWKIEFKYSTSKGKTMAEDLIEQFKGADGNKKKEKKGFF